MKIIFIPNSPFGKYYYDPETCKGVVITKGSAPVGVTMNKNWNPYSFPGSKEMEVDETDYRKLREAALDPYWKEPDDDIKQYFQD